MDSLPLAARRTNCIRWSSTSTSFQDIVSSLPARNSNPRCKGCLGNDCKGCHGTAHLKFGHYTLLSYKRPCLSAARNFSERHSVGKTLIPRVDKCLLVAAW